MSVNRNPKRETRDYILHVITNEWIDSTSILDNCIERFPDVFHKRAWKDNKRIGTKLSAIEYHLKRLKRDGLITSFRDKNDVRYYRRKGGMFDFETESENEIIAFSQ